LKNARRFIVCYVTDRQSLRLDAGQSRESALVRRIENAVRAGLDWIQIREKDLPARDLLGVTRRAIGLCKSTSAQTETRILVNDRLDVAWAAGAAGIHAGENSPPLRVLVQSVHVSLATDFLVGASCHSLASAANAAEAGADYLFFGPIFDTPSKARFGPAQGLAKLAQICVAVSIPVIAIGGITVENAGQCLEAGAAGIAAIRLFQQDGNIPETAAQLTHK
jgi:thiamine-phosphate pyrophosphorylase